MEKEPELFKGELMEELIRNYFLNLGYYVVRGVKYRYENIDITDVDIYIYMRTSSLSRERINVDIKNKKAPQTFERILWANGLKKLLNFDTCIVATTDQRPVIHSFGQLHKTTILDGVFLSKLRPNQIDHRLSEEEILSMLSSNKSYKNFPNKDWRYIYELSKSKLLSEQDFSGLNSTIYTLNYFIEKAITDQQKRPIATRMVYAVLSHLLIIVDYILKDIAFLEQRERERKLSDGLNFGNLGKDGVDKIIQIAVQLSGTKSSQEFLKSLDNSQTNILKDFFGKNDNAKNLFFWARELEAVAFKKDLLRPDQLDSPLRGVLSVMLDYLGINRKRFFDIYEVAV